MAPRFSWHTESGPVPALAEGLSAFARGEAALAGIDLCLVLSADGSLPPGVPAPGSGWSGYATSRTAVPEVWLNLAAPQRALPSREELAAGVATAADGWAMSACLLRDEGEPADEDGLLADLLDATASLLPSWDAASLPGTDPLRATLAHEVGHLLCDRLQAEGTLPADAEGLRHWLAGGNRGRTWHPDVPGDWDSCPCCVHAVAEWDGPEEWFAEAWAMLRCGHRDELARFGTGLVRRLESLA